MPTGIIATSMQKKYLTVQWSRKGSEGTPPAGGFFGFLDRLRAKPVHVRERLAWFSTIALSLIIGSVWWNSWNAQSAFGEEHTAAVASPWSMVRETLVGATGAAAGVYGDTVDGLRTIGADTEAQYANTQDDIVYPSDLGRDIGATEGGVND